MKRNFTHYALLAGLAGGLAEFIWITGYCFAAGSDGWQVARMVAEAVVPAGAAWLATPALGIGIHFLLSILLASAFIAALSPWQLRNAGVTVAISLMALAVVWVVNFLVVLPIVHPVFVDLLPYPVTLLSKLLFGLAMAQVLAAVPGRTTGVVSDTRLARDRKQAVT